ncbi:MAG TPA: TIGR00730 family Rossman fold protein [Chloroflexota bacterium]|nr:TIGR00730 family Rossman fold protein [Chloroflexota bacterium]
MIGVFAGSGLGNWPTYRRAAVQLVEELLRRDVGVVYGGAKIGLMGVVADTMMAGGGKVIGVIPERLVVGEVAHEGLSDLRIVGSMHERKAMIAEVAEGFVSLPGGLGTFEEALEMATWSQLGIHSKPCGMLNVNGFFDPLLVQLDLAVQAGFMDAEHRGLLVSEHRPRQLLDRLEAWTAPTPKTYEGRESAALRR